MLPDIFPAYFVVEIYMIFLYSSALRILVHMEPGGIWITCCRKFQRKIFERVHRYKLLRLSSTLCLHHTCEITKIQGLKYMEIIYVSLLGLVYSMEGFEVELFCLSSFKAHLIGLFGQVTKTGMRVFLTSFYGLVNSYLYILCSGSQ